jgi:hypothetical protein
VLTSENFCQEEYRVNLLLDNLPIAMPVYMTEETPEGKSTGKKQIFFKFLIFLDFFFSRAQRLENRHKNCTLVF